MSKIFKSCWITLLSITVFSCGNDLSNDLSKNVTEVIQQEKSLSTLSQALEATNLDNVLSDKSQSFTVFAPTNSAFKQLPSRTLEVLLDNTGSLSDLLLYHVLTDKALNSDIAIQMANDTVTTANGDEL